MAYLATIRSHRLNDLNALMLPLRLVPGDDLRHSLEQAVRNAALPGAFVVSGIGSLRVAVLRYAGSQQTTRIETDLELLSLAGSISCDGAHLHAVVADAQGRVLGGHLCHGSLVRTTAELLLAVMPATRPLKRRHDERTGFSELVLDEGANEANHLAPPQSRQP
jgi:predicted DNA-binding protein with PD1-like motif